MKRSLKILGGIVAVAVGGVGYLTYANMTRSSEIRQSSKVGQVISGGQPNTMQISEETQRKLARVHAQEAEDKRRKGESYIPEMIFGEPIPVEPKANEAPTQVAQAQPQPEAPPRNRYADDRLRPQIQDEARKAQWEAIEQGLMSQVGMMLQSLQPATAVPVALPLSVQAKEEALARQAQVAQLAAAQAQAQNADAGGANNSKNQGSLLVGGDEIVAARLLTPVNTDKTRFVLVEIVGGKLAGAQLRGEVVPMNMSGDIEDVGFRLTSMRFNNEHYPIDAIALNEQTATDAMDGKVDRRIFSRYVMPVLMAGFSGASTYFTARGTPSISVAQGIGTNDAVIVDQERASREDAKNQGIGRAIDEGVSSANRVIDRLGNRPNKVELPANLPIGVIFNAPVYHQQG